MADDNKVGIDSGLTFAYHTLFYRRAFGDLQMYAVVVNGGKQYRVKEGQSLNVEKLALDPGDTFSFDQVLMIADGGNLHIGTPYIQTGKVTASVEAHGRDKKIKILKFRRRKHHLKRMGHRQWFTRIKINSIQA